MPRRHARAFAVVAALVLILVGSFAPPAAAAGPVACTASIEGQRIENDLVVPDDGHCFLDHVVKAGTVTVGDRAELDLLDSVADTQVGGARSGQCAPQP